MRERNYYDWEAVVAKTRRRPLVWLPLFPDHPADLVEAINRRRSSKLRLEDGRLEATAINRYRQPGFPERGDIWVRWIPLTTRTTRKDHHGREEDDSSSPAAHKEDHP